jgi:hypothetical protein
MVRLQSDDVVVLRVDGKNIYSTVLDTNDISTQRGASYELLDTALRVGEEVKANHNANAKVVSLGASSAVIEVKHSALSTLVPAIRKIFSEPAKAHFTHDLSIVAKQGRDANAFSVAEKGAIAASRWHQLQRVTVGIPTVVSGVSDVCEFDRVRPATRKIPLSKPSNNASDFVFNRREQGRKLRQNLYNEIFKNAAVSQLSAKNSVGFTSDLHQLSEYEGSQKEQIDFRMNNKIAVIYADGNGFGRIAANASEHNVLGAWDGFIRTLRANLLKHLLESADATPLMIAKNEEAQKVLRLETLEWGGDEMMWVVPAAFGFDFVQKILEFTANWNTANCPEYNNAVNNGSSGDGSRGEPLHHSIGMVFCHRNAPIVRIRQLVQRLGDKGKDKGKSKTSPCNTLTWTALESFDHLGVDFEAGLTRRYNKALTAADWTLNPTELKNLTDFFDAHKAQLPRAQITAAAMRCVHSTMPDSAKVLAHAYRECFFAEQSPAVAQAWHALSGKPAIKAALIETSDLDPAEKRAWIWLAETFDYMGSKLA